MVRSFCTIPDWYNVTVFILNSPSGFSDWLNWSEISRPRPFCLLIKWRLETTKTADANWQVCRDYAILCWTTLKMCGLASECASSETELKMAANSILKEIKLLHGYTTP